MSGENRIVWNPACLFSSPPPPPPSPPLPPPSFLPSAPPSPPPLPSSPYTISFTTAIRVAKDEIDDLSVQDLTMKLKNITGENNVDVSLFTKTTVVISVSEGTSVQDVRDTLQTSFPDATITIVTSSRRLLSFRRLSSSDVTFLITENINTTTGDYPPSPSEKQAALNSLIVFNALFWSIPGIFFIKASILTASSKCASLK